MRVDTVLTPSAAIAMSNKGESKVLSLMMGVILVFSNLGMAISS